MKTFLKIISIFFILIFTSLLFIFIKDYLRTEAQIINSNWNLQLPKDLKLDYEFFESPDQNGKIYRVFSVEDKDVDNFAPWKKGPNSSVEISMKNLIEFLNIDENYMVNFSGNYFYYEKTKSPQNDTIEQENKAYKQLYMFYFPSQKRIYVIENLM